MRLQHIIFYKGLFVRSRLHSTFLIKHGDAVVIRYVGPKGKQTFPLSIPYFRPSPGMPETLRLALVGAGMGKTVSLISDGRFSDASYGFNTEILIRLPLSLSKCHPDDCRFSNSSCELGFSTNRGQKL